MTVRVLTCSASTILQGKIPGVRNVQSVSGKLTIPEYQRPYCWQGQQLSKLLADIKSHNEQTPELPYYLGSLILHNHNDKLNRDCKKYYLIDARVFVRTLPSSLAFAIAL